MRTTLRLIFAFLFLALPVMAQDPDQPEHFIGIGGGIDADASTDSATGLFSYGHKITDSQYLVTSVVMREDFSTLSEAFLQVITRQGPVTLFGLGQIGVEVGGQGLDPGTRTTNLNLGGGMGLDISLARLTPKLKNVSITGIMKLLKANNAEIPNAVMPRFETEIIYKFGK